MAGISLRIVRSPEAPKMTSTHGSGVRRSWSPSSSGFCCWGSSVTAIGLRSRLHRMAAELVAQRRVHLRRVALLLARREAREERGRDHRRGDALVDRLQHGPAALAGVLDVALDALEV